MWDLLKGFLYLDFIEKDALTRVKNISFITSSSLCHPTEDEDLVAMGYASMSCSA